MYVAHLSLTDWRSYPTAELTLEPGVSTFLGANGHGKTNVVEAICYLGTLSSHRAATDAPLVREGAERSIVRADVVRDGRHALIEVEVNPGRTNRARINRGAVPRARDVVGLVRAVLFAPEDLALIKGDPDGRRRFMDELLVLRTPRLAGVRADYDRVLKQRNSLLRSSGTARGTAGRETLLATLSVWDEQLVRFGSELVSARLRLVSALRPTLTAAYVGIAPGRGEPALAYRASLGPVERGAADDVAAMAGVSAELEEIAARANGIAELGTLMQAQLELRRRDELDRGVTLVGPHRDDVVVSLGSMPARGFASHGESWSLALSARLAAHDLLADDGDEPILVLDDVFAELDVSRRAALAGRVAGAQQVLVTAAVEADVPEILRGRRFDVEPGSVRRA
ncbi:MAG TPA: DNA replication/repair protein RecF [Actinopolymorphaceae bacterium]